MPSLPSVHQSSPVSTVLSPPSTILYTPTPTRHSRTFSSFVCGGLASATNIIIIFPLHKTIFFQQLHGCTWLSAVKEIYHERLPNLYRGVLPPLLQKSVSLSVMFGVYAEAEARYSKRFTTNPVTHRAISALCAGTMESALVPFERIQTLLQNQRSVVRFRHTFDAFRGILLNGHGGLRELYRGFVPCLMRNCVGNVSYFVLRDEVFRYWPSDESHGSRTLMRDFATGALLGALISTINFPLNVIKTHVQSQIGATPQTATFRSCVRSIYAERGYSILRFYRGMPANCMRSMLAWGIITTANDYYQYLFFS